MSYESEQFDLLKNKLIEIKLAYQNANDYNFALFKTISQFYLFLEDISIKPSLIKNILNMCYLNDQEMINLIYYVLDKNILLIDERIIYNRWQLVLESVKRVEYELIKIDKLYQIFNKKEYEIVDYKELINF